tara:strand:- start:273 stop:578 length:306 start_codon:yes stop_codon:yes gene_type:complete
LYSHGLSLGILPEQFWTLTFFELASISKGKLNQDKTLWNHTSTVMSLMANANRNSKKRPTPYKPSDFNPYHEELEDIEVNEITPEDIEQIASWQVNSHSSP